MPEPKGREKERTPTAANAFSKIWEIVGSVGVNIGVSALVVVVSSISLLNDMQAIFGHNDYFLDVLGLIVPLLGIVSAAAYAAANWTKRGPRGMAKVSLTLQNAYTLALDHTGLNPAKNGGDTHD